MSSLTSRRLPAWRAVIFAAAVQAGLSACTSFSRDGGFEAVAASTSSRLDKHVCWPRSAAEADKNAAAVTQLLSRPLGADDAVQVALLNNRGLRASFEDLQISEADLVQAGRLPNPRLDFAHAAGGGQVDIAATLSFNVLSLLTLPYARDIEKQRFAQTQTAVFLGVAQLAAQTREAYLDAVAAQQSLAYRQQVSDAAEAGAVLAQRMQAAGNWNSIDRAREQVFYADATRALTRAEAADAAARAKLESLLGEPGDSASAAALQLAAALPELPASIQGLPDVERTVLQNRIDLQLMRENIDALAHRLKWVRATRFVNVLDLGPSWVQQGPRDAPHERGYAVTLEVPIFDDGAARLKKSDALYIQAVERFAQAAIDARAEVRRAYAAYAASFELAKRQRDLVVPLRKSVAAENLLRYNASLISIFELLADAREQISSVDDYIADLRDFWLAKSRLDAALIGTPPPALGAAPSTLPTHPRSP
jgi:outer membrane protein TolC